MTLACLAGIYVALYATLSAQGRFAAVWGTARTPAGASVRWDGEAWVPRGFPGDRDHPLSILCAPLIWLDQRFWHHI